MDDRVCMHYVIDRIESAMTFSNRSDAIFQALNEFRHELIFNLGVNQRIKLNETETLPEPVVQEPQFRDDMNLEAAIDDLSDAYLQEAKRRVGKVSASKTKVAKMLGFKDLNRFSYWLKKHNKRKGN